MRPMSSRSSSQRRMSQLRLCNYYFTLLLLLTLVWLHPKTVTSSENDDDNGLQIWDTPSSFNQALNGGRLLLVIITASWCDRGDVLETLAAQAANRIDDVFFTSSGSHTGGEVPLHYSASLPKPLIGLLPSDTASRVLLDGLGPITHYPAFKFVLSSAPYNCSFVNDGEKQQSNNDENDEIDETKLWDYIGPKETAEDIYDSVIMYYYRNVVSSHISKCGPHKRTRTAAIKSETEISSNKHKQHNPPIFEFTSQSQLSSFLERHGEQVLRPAQARYRHQSAFEKVMFEIYTGLQHNDNAIGGIFYPFDYQSLSEDEVRKHNKHMYTQEIDPYILFVQCRLSKRKSATEEDQSKEAKRIFDEVAEEMIHRRDVAFFTLTVANNAKSCGGWFPKVSDGAIAVVRAKRSVDYSLSSPEKSTSSDQSLWSRRQKRVIHNVTTDWNGLKRRAPHALFIPTEYSTEEDIVTNFTKFTVLHTTPTVMWFDTSRVAQLAFPNYRAIHAVLFIDMALGYQIHSPSSTKYIQNDWPENLAHTVETERLILDQQRAIQMFYNAALQYRSQHIDDDVVFLIVPSSETRILTTFGVDLWTPLDEALFGGGVEQKKSNPDDEMDHATTCRRDSSPIMPIMAVTDASKRTGKQTSRYYLCSEDMFDPSNILFEHGGAVKSFIDNVLDTSAMPFTRSEHSQVNAEPLATKSNVTVVTGNTFQSLVMDREEEHTMLLMKQSTCGHCKRFSIFWNEFQTLIDALNWSSVISVAKIEVTKNDVPHPQIDAWDLPSVYYFPAGSKETPIEMTPKYDKDSIDAQYQYDEGLSWVRSGYDVVEWMMKQGKLDLELLASLDVNRANSIDDDIASR